MPDNHIGAKTKDNTVTINSNGHCFSQFVDNDDGTVTNWGYRTGLSGADWQAFILLHELEHLTGISGFDPDMPSNDANSNKVLDK